jgi:hypothetical protein
MSKKGFECVQTSKLKLSCMKQCDDLAIVYEQCILQFSQNLTKLFCQACILIK